MVTTQFHQKIPPKIGKGKKKVIKKVIFSGDNQKITPKIGTLLSCE